MLNNVLKTNTYTVLILLIFTGCKKNYIDPSKIADAFSTARGMTGVVIGLQRTYTVGRASCLYNSISINGLVTNELIVANPGNAAEMQLQTGGPSVDPTHTMLSTYWINNNKIIYDANLVIINASKLVNKNYASGLIAYASIFKALCIGNLAMYWEKIPDTIGKNVNFVSRVDGFKKAVQVLDRALVAVNTHSISTDFISSIPAGIDIVNTLYALKARYALFAGDYSTAFAAANAVILSKKSVFNFEAAFPNPIFENVANKVVQAKNDTLGLPDLLRPSLTDTRVPFYVITNVTDPFFRVAGFGATSLTPIPVYLPGEMALIKAEVYARQNDSTNSRIQLNIILTKTPAMDPFGVGANQPAMTIVGSYKNLLDQIYLNRCIELYMSGLKLEDMRRFGRQVVPPNSESKRNFMPYPFRESDNNPNTPPNPAF